MGWEQRNVHGRAPRQGVTLPNPASPCPCKTEEPAVPHNSPDSSYVVTATGKAEPTLPAPEGGWCSTAFPNPQEVWKFIQTAAPPLVAASGEPAAMSGAGARRPFSLSFSLTRKWCHLSKHVHQLAESNKPQHLTWQDFAAKQSS